MGNWRKHVFENADRAPFSEADTVADIRLLVGVRYTWVGSLAAMEGCNSG